LTCGGSASAHASSAAQDDAEPTPEVITDIPPLAEEAQGIEYTDLPELGFEGEIRMYAAAYTPVSPTATKPNPPSYLNRLIAEYQKCRPGLSIRLDPPLSSGADRVTYLQTQATSGQMNDIEQHNGTGPINNLVEIGVFKPYDEAMEKPNPYISEGHPGS